MAIIKVKTGGITADAVTATEIADNAVVTAAINADAVTDAKIADDVVGTEHLTANEVDTAALKGDAVTGAELADNAVNSEHYTDGSIDTAHIAADQITAAKIADDAISEEHLDVTAVTGHTAETSVADGDLVVIHDASASALRKMTVANLVANAGGGKVLQVVSDTLTSEYTTGSASFGDVGLTVAITPSASSSKILIMVTGQGYSNTAASRFLLTVLRGSTNLATGDSSGAFGFAGLSVNEGIQLVGSLAFNHLDSPSSTSELTYKVQGRLQPASGAGQLSLNSTTSTIIAIEIGA